MINDVERQPAVDGRKRRGMAGGKEDFQYEDMAAAGRRRRGEVMSEKMAG